MKQTTNLNKQYIKIRIYEGYVEKIFRPLAKHSTGGKMFYEVDSFIP